MSFYGNITNTSRTTFQFDKIYPSRYAMDTHSQVDGIYAGRYVLVEYDNEISEIDYDKGWYLISNGQRHVPYGSIDSCKEGENNYLYFNGPVENTHYTAEDINVSVLYFAPHKHFTILNDNIIYIKVKKNGSYTEVSQQEFEEQYDENDIPPHVHIANNIAHFDNIEIFPDENTYIYAKVLPGQKYQYNEKGELWSVNNSDTFTIRIDGVVYTFKQMTQLSNSTSSYLANFNIDISYYNTSRGYDSTVWQKVYSNGIEKYVMIAELNTVVPTFGVTADAPSMLPIAPHFGADTTNVYYDLHWQPSWGFRIKAANNLWNVSQIEPNGKLVLRNENDIQSQINNIRTRKNDSVFYPSDQFITWSQTFEDNTLTGDSERKTLYYNSETQKWGQDSSSQIPAAIYFNKDGFNSSEISYSNDLISEESKTSTWGKYRQVIANSNWKNNDAITITPTGISGNNYNSHDGTFDNKPQEDIQELSIMLPSVGDTMARIWDLVYGGRDTTEGIKLTNLRNKDIAWENAKAEPSRRGLRLVGQGGDEYNTAEVDTLAGAINTAHDLIGMIISSNSNEELQDLERLDKNYIYYNTDLKKYFRKHETYDFEEVENSNFVYDIFSSNTLSQEEIDKGLYYIYDNVNNTYVLATIYREGTQYYTKRVRTPYSEVEYELYDFPYTDNEGRTYRWYQDYISDNVQHIDNLDDPTIKDLRSDYIYDSEYHPDRSYYYIEPEPVTLTANYSPKKYWYKTKNNDINIFKLDMEEEQTHNRAYYTFNPSSLIRCPSTTMVYVPGVYYFKRQNSNDENSYSYELDISENRSQNYSYGVGVYKDQSNSVVYYQLNIITIKNASGEEVLYRVIYEYEDVGTLTAGEFLTDIYYYKDNNNEYQLAIEYVEGQYYYYRKTTYEKTDGNQVDVEVLKEWYENDLILHRAETFYTVIKDTNSDIIQLTELTKQTLLDKRDQIFNQEIYVFGQTGQYDRPYLTINEAEEENIITLQNDFYQSNIYHYMRNDTYILDTNSQYTENRQYYIIDKPPLRLNNNIHFYEKDKYYTETQNEEGFELVSSQKMPENITFYNKNDYYVINDTRNLLSYGSKWNLNLLNIPDSITLGKRITRYELIELPNYSVNTNTLNGMLIKIHQLLEINDNLTRSSENLSGLMNQLKDLLASFSIVKSREFMIVDDYGRYHNAPFRGDNWLKLTVDGDPESPSIKIDHTFNPENDTTSTLDVNGNGNTISLYTPILDDNGHVVAKDTKTVTLPYSFKTIKTNKVGNSEQNMSIDGSADIIADSTQDTLIINSDNAWIRIKGDSSNDTLTFAHEIHNIDVVNATDGNFNTNNSNTFTVTDISNDKAGHIIANKKHTYTLPYNWKTFTSSGINASENDLAFPENNQHEPIYSSSIDADNCKASIAIEPGNTWLKMIAESTTNNDQISNKFTIAHTVNPIETTPKADTDLDGIGYFTVQDISKDNAGHITSIQNHKYILPHAWCNFKVGNDTISANDYEGTAKFVGDNWVGISLIDETEGQNPVTDTIQFIHKTAIEDPTFVIPNNDTPAFNETFSVPYIGIDSNGHIHTLGNKTVTIPNITLTNAQSGNVVTGISYVNGAFTESKTNVGTLLLTNFTTDSTSTTLDLANSDSINTAFGKLEKRIKEEETNRRDAINNLDANISDVFGQGKTLLTLTEEDGIISCTTQDIYITGNQVKVGTIPNGLETADLTLTNWINSLDFTASGLGAGKTITALTQVDGKVSTTVSDIAITASQVTVDDNTNFDARYYTETEIDTKIGGLTANNNISSDEVHLLKSLSEANGVISYTSEKLAWSHISALLPSGNNAFVTQAELNNHTHSITLIADTNASTITLSSGGTYKLTAGGNSIIFALDNFASSNHNHNGIYQPVGNYAESLHNHTLSNITDIGTISDVVGIEKQPAVAPNPEVPGDEGTPAVLTENLIDYIKWLENRIIALEASI